MPDQTMGIQEDASIIANPGPTEELEEVVGEAIESHEEPVEEDKGYYMITCDELKERLDAGWLEDGVVLDGRGTFLYKTSHFPGSVDYSFSKHGPEDFVRDFPDRDKIYVFVCHNGSMSDKVALHLAVKYDYTRMYVLKGGFMMWSGQMYGEPYYEQPGRPDWTRKRFWRSKLGLGKKNQ